MTLLDEAISPATAVAKLQAAGIQISERALRERARRLGACRVLGKTMFLMPDDITTIINAARPEPSPCRISTSEKEVRSGGTISKWTERDTEDLLKQLRSGKRKPSQTLKKSASVTLLNTAKKKS